MKMQNKKGFTLIIILIGILTVCIINKERILKTYEQMSSKIALQSPQSTAYDKLKITKININKRLTGEAPFDKTSPTNTNGYDDTDNNDYVRTLDTITYNVEVNIANNNSTGGFNDAVIKVRAKLPNQEKAPIMVWEKSAWMENYKEQDDGRTITAEYHFPANTSISNATQSLTFIARMGGDRIEIPANSPMLPEFEVWMEGNNPDNQESTAQSMKTKDTKKLIITGREENLKITFPRPGNAYKIKGNKEIDGQVVEGTYVSINMDIAMGFNGVGKLFWGPDIDLTMRYKVEELIKDSTGKIISDKIVTSDMASNSINKVNGVIFIGATFSGIKKDGIYPTPNNVGTGPYSNRHVDGTISAAQKDDEVTFKFHSNLDSRANSISFSGGDPNFLDSYSIIVQFFVPYTKDGTDYYFRGEIVDLDYNLRYEEKRKAEVNTEGRVDGPKVTTGTTRTTVPKKLENITTIVHPGNSEPTTIPKEFYRSSKYYGHEKYAVVGSSIEVVNEVTSHGGAFEGGMDTFFLWRNDIMYLTKFDKKGKYDIPSKDNYVLTNMEANYVYGDIASSDIVVKYGVYKKNPQKGLITNEEVNKAKYEDFTWYDSPSKISYSEEISSIYIRETKFKGNGVRNYKIKLQTYNNEKYIGMQVPVLAKTRMYEKESSPTTKEGIYYSYDYEGLKPIEPDVYDKGDYIAASKYKTNFLIVGSRTVGLIKTNKDKEYNMFDSFDKNNNYVTGISAHDGYVDFQINPIKKSTDNIKLSNNKISEKTRITVILPKGLKLASGSFSKIPSLITEYQDGHSEIIWGFSNWQSDLPAPGGKEITFSANILPNVETDKILEVKTIVDDSNENVTTESKTYIKKIKIYNLQGNYISRSTNKKFINKDDTFIVSTVIGNNSSDKLTNVRTVDILPKEGFVGTYEIAPSALMPNQKVYYTTEPIASSGIVIEGSTYSAKNIDFTTNTKWKEVKLNERIPSSATVIATVTPEITNYALNEFSYTVYTSGNAKNNKYEFTTSLTSNNVGGLLQSNTVSSTVCNRFISGKIFLDEDGDGLYSLSEEFKPQFIGIYLLDEDGQMVDYMDSNSLHTINGDITYIFDDLKPGKYYIEVNLIEFEVTSKGYTDNSNKIGYNLKSDLIDLSGTPTSEEFADPHVNIGLRWIKFELCVNHIIMDEDRFDWPNPDAFYLKRYQEYGTKIEHYGTYHMGDNYKIYPYENLPYHTFSYSSEPLSGKVDGRLYEINLYYKKKPARVITHYYDEETNNKLIPDTEENVFMTDFYANYMDYEIGDYELAENQRNCERYIENEIEECDLYYRLKNGTVEINHLEIDTDKVIAPKESNTIKFRQEYNTSPSSKVPSNYELVATPNNATGIISSTTVDKQNKIIVNYYYKKKDSNVSSTLEITGPKEINNDTKTIDYEINYNPTIKDYVGNATITITDTVPYEIDIDNSNLDGGTYNKAKNTITWEIPWNDINVGTSGVDNKITKNISLKYTNMDKSIRTLNNKVTSSLKLDTKEDKKENNVNTPVKITGSIIVHHYLKGTTTKIAEDTSSTGLYGDTYIINEANNPAYIGVDSNIKTIKYNDQTQEVIYEYEKIKFTIKTIVSGKGGNVLGNEELYYNETSKEDIIITPQDGYEIDKITINGKKYELTEKEKTSLILNKISNVKENKTIVITFKPVSEIENPNTSPIFTKNSVILLFIISALALILYKKPKIRFKKL